MADQWYALVDENTGDAYSFCTIVTDPLPEGLQVVELPMYPDMLLWYWEPSLRALLPRAADLDI